MSLLVAPRRLQGGCNEVFATDPFTMRHHLALLPLTALLLAACGGGSSSTDAGTSNEAAALASADTLQAPADAGAALDASLLTAQTVVATQALAAGTAAVPALAAEVQPLSIAQVPVACPGGGQALLSITGGTAASVLNGQLDTGEVYELVFSDCRAAQAAVVVNGSLRLSVLTATDKDWSLQWAAQALAVGLPRARSTLDGQVATQVSRSTQADGSTLLGSQLQADSLGLANTVGSRTRQYSLSALALQRSSVWQAGQPVSSSLSGQLTLSASGPAGSTQLSASVQSQVSRQADGAPASGHWTLTLPQAALDLTLANAVATLSLDEGPDGTVDRRWQLSLDRLLAASD